MTLDETSFRFVRKSLGLSQLDMARLLDVDRTYLSQVENKRRTASSKLQEKLLDLKKELEKKQRSALVKQLGGRAIPVVSWARAGVASSYEEMQGDWVESLLSDCPDEQAFALTLEGDSMEPKFFTKDVVVLMPQRIPHTNQLVGARIRDLGVVFKILTIQSGPQRFRFSSYNSETYPSFELREEEVVWMYPAYEVRRRLWHK